MSERVNEIDECIPGGYAEGNNTTLLTICNTKCGTDSLTH